MKGYKAFNSDLTCRGFQFEIGKEYVHDGKIAVCESGFHFCKSLADCYQFYPMSEDTRICKVEATGDVITEDNVKYCTNKIKILSEVSKPRVKSNLSESSSGYCNSGYCNSGDSNSGNCNSGNRNSGNWNSGNRNSGDWNSGNSNSGIFNSITPKINMFNKATDWTYNDWYYSKAYDVMARCPYTTTKFIETSKMSDEEKEKHPEHKTIGGYLKTIIVTQEDKQKWWDKLSAINKQAVYDLPNFDADVFEQCTGIKAVI